MATRNLPEHERASPTRRPAAEAPAADAGAAPHPLAALQRQVGNAAVSRLLADQGASVQRDGDFQLSMPELGSSLRQRQQPLLNLPRLRLNVMNLRGVTQLQPLDPAPPSWLTQPPAADQESDDKPDDLWSLDFDMEINPNSSLGRSLAQQEVLNQLLSGEEARGTPLGLRLVNAAVNVLAATPGGQNLRRRLHLEDVTITLNPSEGNYGVSATFRFP